MKNLLLATAATLALSPTAAFAGPIAYDEVLGIGADVVVTYVGYSAADTDTVQLVMGSTIFTNQTTPMGTSIDLGAFAAGKEVKFEIENLTTGEDFFSGPASRNPDDLIHADVVTDPTAIPSFLSLPSAAQTYALSLEGPGTVIIGIEDLDESVSDQDYNDLVFAAHSVDPGPVPEPSGLAIIGTALMFLGLKFRAARRMFRGGGARA